MNAAQWLNNKFSEWQIESGKKQNIRSFAKYLNVRETSLSGWMNGAHPPAGDNLRKIARKLGFEIYEILGVPAPDQDQLDDIPPNLRIRFERAFREVKDEYEARHINLDDPEAERIAIEILERNGFKYTKTENDD